MLQLRTFVWYFLTFHFAVRRWFIFDNGLRERCLRSPFRAIRIHVYFRICFSPPSKRLAAACKCCAVPFHLEQQKGTTRESLSWCISSGIYLIFCTKPRLRETTGPSEELPRIWMFDITQITNSFGYSQWLVQMGIKVTYISQMTRTSSQKYFMENFVMRCSPRKCTDREIYSLSQTLVIQRNSRF